MLRGIPNVVVCSIHALVACLAAGPATSQTIAEARPGQLERFASARVMVYPIQTLPIIEPSAWRTDIGPASAFLTRADTAVEQALGGRGLDGTWVFPPALRRSARRNPTYISDPHSVRVAAAVMSSARKRDTQIAEPAASQIRALAAVSDARFALIPVELRFQASGALSTAILRWAVVDARLAQVVWLGEVSSNSRPAFSFEMIEELAQRTADLAVAR
ncbi:MAG: hypothetical protein ACT4OZ_01490 [Gemmatimonadota bacterium]